MTGEWIKVTGDTGYIYDVFIGESEDQPELEDMLTPPKRGVWSRS